MKVAAAWLRGQLAIFALATILAVLAMLVILSGCSIGAGAPAGAASGDSAPSLDPARIELLLLRADDVRRQAYTDASPLPLEGLYAGPAMLAARSQLAEMARRGQRREERVTSRVLVHAGSSPGDAEGVIEVRGSQRLISSTRPDPTWANTLRQWDARLHWRGDRWWVIDDQDLAPDRWWHP